VPSFNFKILPLGRIERTSTRETRAAPLVRRKIWVRGLGGAGMRNSFTEQCGPALSIPQISLVCSWFWKAFQLKLLFDLNEPPTLFFGWKSPRD
jgi:hypothetical protein